MSVLRFKLKCLAPFTDSIYVFHLGISIFLCPGLISVLWTGPEGEDSFQLPVTDGGCISHQQQSETTNKYIWGFLKSIEGLAHFVFPPQSLLPPWLQLCPASGTICIFMFECCWREECHHGTGCARLWMQPPHWPFHLLSRGTLGFSSHPKTSQGRETQTDFLSPLFAPRGQRGGCRASTGGTHTPQQTPQNPGEMETF